MSGIASVCTNTGKMGRFSGAQGAANARNFSYRYPSQENLLQGHGNCTEGLRASNPMPVGLSLWACPGDSRRRSIALTKERPLKNP